MFSTYKSLLKVPVLNYPSGTLGNRFVKTISVGIWASAAAELCMFTREARGGSRTSRYLLIVTAEVVNVFSLWLIV